MNCNVHKLNLCFLKQETPNNPTFKFDTDISNDSFTYTVKNYNIGQTVVYGIGSGITVVDNHTIEIEIPIDQMVIGSYSHELLWETANGTKRVVFQGLLKISETGEYCADCQTEIGEYTVNIVNDEIVINVVLGSGGSGNVLGIIPSWRSKELTRGIVQTDIPFIDEGWQTEPEITILSVRSNLQLQIIGYDSIKNDNPVLIIERYKKAKKDRVKYRNETGTDWIKFETRLKGGFTKQKNPARISEIPINAEIMENVDFSQETYFKPEYNNGLFFRARGSSYKNQPQFQFRIKTDKGISPPILRMALRRGRHQIDFDKHTGGGTTSNGITFTNAELSSVTDYKFFCLIGYSIL